MTNPRDPINAVNEDLAARESETGIKSPFGLTKREYFAAMAMQGIIGKLNVHEYKDMAKYSVNAADALITALNQPDNLTKQ